MQNDTFRRSPMQNSHFESGFYGACCHQSIAEGIADNLPIEQFQNDRQILPATAGSHIGDIAGPDLVRRIDGKILLQTNGFDWLVMIRVRRDLELPCHFGSQTHESHHTGRLRSPTW